jgi:hypothetical protein
MDLVHLLLLGWPDVLGNHGGASDGDGRRKIKKLADMKKKPKHDGEGEVWEGDGILPVPFCRGRAKILDPFCSHINHCAWFP